MAVFNVSSPTGWIMGPSGDDNVRTRPPSGPGTRYMSPFPPMTVSSPQPNRFSDDSQATKFGISVAFRDPYGNRRAAARAARGHAPVATADEYRQWLEGTRNQMVPYLGMGENVNFIYATPVYTSGVAPFEASQRFAQFGRQGAGPQSGEVDTAYGRPIYRQGDEIRWARDKTEREIRGWQSFFSGLGFKTGPAGHWTEHEINAMRAFMSMANLTPGGGMTIGTLRQTVMDQVRAGVYFYRGLNEEGDLLPVLLGEDPVGDLTGGAAGGAPMSLEPFTETVTERQIERFSMDEARAGVTRMMAQEIGRDPTEEELKQFVRDLNASLRADPTIITTVTTTDPVTGESTMERTVDESDVSAEGRAITFAEEVSPAERREYQAGRYFDALMAEIGL